MTLNPETAAHRTGAEVFLVGLFRSIAEKFSGAFVRDGMALHDCVPRKAGLEELLGAWGFYSRKIEQQSCLCHLDCREQGEQSSGALEKGQGRALRAYEASSSCGGTNAGFGRKMASVASGVSNPILAISTVFSGFDV